MGALPTFSFAVPVRGQGEYLGKALRSLAWHSLKPHVAVLNATPDNSLDVIIAAHGGLIDHYRHGADHGQSAAIAEGWALRQGDVVGWLNADDYLLPGALDWVAVAFAENPAADVVFAQGMFVSADNAFLGFFPTGPGGPERLPFENRLCQPSVFVRRRALDRIGGIDASRHYVMDWDLWLRLWEAGAKFHFLDRVVSATALHPATKTASGAAARFSEIAGVLARHNNPAGVCKTVCVMRLHDAAEQWRGLPGYLARNARELARRRYADKAGQWRGDLDGEIHIPLPWFADDLPQHIAIDCDGVPVGDVAVDGQPLRLEHGRARLSKPGPGPGHEITLRLDGRRTRLRSAAFH